MFHSSVAALSFQGQQRAHAVGGDLLPRGPRKKKKQEIFTLRFSCAVPTSKPKTSILRQLPFCETFGQFKMSLQLFKSFFVYNELEKELLKDHGDPPLILKHSAVRKFTVDGITLKLRFFQLPHPKGHKLPPMPLIFLIHGLGGQLNQFQNLIDHFSHFSEVVAVDLPGHGRSEYKPNWKIYTADFFVRILEQVLISCVQETGREIVIVGHSMGCILGTMLAKRLGIRCIGIITICPPASLDKGLKDMQAVLGYLPAFIFNMFRAVDRLGGLSSPSVMRMVGKTAPEEVKLKQLRWNLQVNTQAWMRTAAQMKPLTREQWHSLDCPVYMIGAEEDQVTPPSNIDMIRSWLGPKSADIEHTIIHDAGHACIVERPEVVCGLISDFISKSVDQKLSLGWQLAFLASKMDKWSLKNEDKWRKVQSVSEQIEGTPFRGMKTLRQDDPVHSPARLEENYADITDLIDISREAPPYDPTTFAHIKYHKFPTVSKLPPTREEVKRFIELVDSILDANPAAIIAVHCHYGFNRTGFFLCCYMIERLKFSIKKALIAFQKARAPGIKHSHFIDELYVRYEL